MMITIHTTNHNSNHNFNLTTICVVIIVIITIHCNLLKILTINVFFTTFIIYIYIFIYKNLVFKLNKENTVCINSKLSNLIVIDTYTKKNKWYNTVLNHNLVIFKLCIKILTFK